MNLQSNKKVLSEGKFQKSALHFCSHNISLTGLRNPHSHNLITGKCCKDFRKNMFKSAATEGVTGPGLCIGPHWATECVVGTSNFLCGHTVLIKLSINLITMKLITSYPTIVQYVYDSMVKAFEFEEFAFVLLSD